jgi:hypothetical protein
LKNTNFFVIRAQFQSFLTVAYMSKKHLLLWKTYTQQERETSIRNFAICKTNALCEAGFPMLSEMRELNTTIVATRVPMNEKHPIRHFFTNRRIQDEYAMKKGIPSPIFMKKIDDRGEHKESRDSAQ